MLSRVNNEKGFTLIELTIVVMIIGILASISVVVYNNFLKQARVVEAKSFLSTLARQQTAYYVENAKYTDDLLLLGLPALGALKYYNITIAVPAVLEPQRFIATASGNIDSDADLDVWTINQNKVLTNIFAD